MVHFSAAVKEAGEMRGSFSFWGLGVGLSGPSGMLGENSRQEPGSRTEAENAVSWLASPGLPNYLSYRARAQ